MRIALMIEAMVMELVMKPDGGTGSLHERGSLGGA